MSRSRIVSWLLVHALALGAGHALAEDGDAAAAKEPAPAPDTEAAKAPGIPLPSDPTPPSDLANQPAKEPVATPAAPAQSEETTVDAASTPAEPTPEASNKPTLKLGAGVILWYYEPFLEDAKSNVDIFFARLTIDGKSGIWGVHLEPRFRDTKQRGWEDGPIFVQEAYLSANPGPITIKLGKEYSKLGLFWDNSFYGNVQVYDGLKLAPDYGLSVEALHELNQSFALGWTFQYFIRDGRTNVSIPARDIVSVPGGVRRNSFIARVDPEIRFGEGKALRVGVSGQLFEADLPNGDPTVTRIALDAKLTFGGLGVWGEYLHQDGRHVTDFPVAAVPPATTGRASANNHYVLAGAEYTYEWVTARFNASYGNYADEDVSETFYVPGLQVKPIPELGLLAEYVHWRRKTPTGEDWVDHSLNVTASAFYDHDEPSWDLEELVVALRAARTGQSEWRRDEALQRQRPSRDALVSIVKQLRAALFPSHFGVSDFTESSIDFFVGHSVDAALRALEEQVRRGLTYDVHAKGGDRSSLGRRARAITREFASQLPRVRALLEQDIRATYEGDPAARSRSEVIFCYPGITAAIHHRLAHELYRLEQFLLARVVSEIAHSTTGIDIHPGAQIGERFFVDHGTGVVVGETAVIGNRVKLYQGVTIGARNFPKDDDGTAVKGAVRHPIIEDDVVIYAGATVLGRITIGKGSTVGGNVWLTRDLPPGSVVTQAKVREQDP